MASHSISGRKVYGCDFELADRRKAQPSQAAVDRSNEIRAILPSLISFPQPPESIHRYREKMFRKAGGLKVRSVSLARLFVTLEPTVCILLICYAFYGFAAVAWQLYASGTVSWWHLISALLSVVAWFVVEAFNQRAALPSSGVSLGWGKPYWSRAPISEWTRSHQVPDFVSSVSTLVRERFPDIRCTVEKLHRQWGEDDEEIGPIILSAQLPDQTPFYPAAWTETTDTVKLIAL